MSKSFQDTRILFSTPCSLETLYKAWFESFMRLGKPNNWGFRMDSVLPLDKNRNNTVTQALEQGFDYIMWIDHDQILDPECLARMWGHGFQVMGTLYFERSYPHLPLIYVFPPELNNIGVVSDFPIGIVKCDVMGMGCSLWKTEVFKKIPEPWFAYNDGTNQWGTEDVCVFLKLKAAGIPVYVDTQHPVGHLGSHITTVDDWLRAKPNLAKWRESPEGQRILCPIKSKSSEQPGDCKPSTIP